MRISWENQWCRKYRFRCYAENVYPHPLSALHQPETPNMEEMSTLWPRWPSLCMLTGHDLIVHYFKANVPSFTSLYSPISWQIRKNWVTSEAQVEEGFLLGAVFQKHGQMFAKGRHCVYGRVVRQHCQFPRRHMSPRVMQCQPWLPYWANV